MNDSNHANRSVTIPAHLDLVLEPDEADRIAKARADNCERAKKSKGTLTSGQLLGYTDNQGDPAANKTLSDARAATVKKELSAQGIAGERIEAVGRGEADPIADKATEDGRAKNRRTELVIIRK